MQWIIEEYWPKKILSNWSFGLEVEYTGLHKEWAFHLHPYIDDTNKTIKYFCFWSIEQKLVFEKMLKISGVWPKTALGISALPLQVLKDAIDSFDTKVLESIPGIGAKTAKKIMVELKDTLSHDDVTKLSADTKVINNIVKTLTTMWYNKEKVIKALNDYPGTISKDVIQEIVVWLINSIK